MKRIPSVVSRLRAAIVRFSHAADVREDIEQRFYEDVMLGSARHAAPKIGTYTGQGPLGRWFECHGREHIHAGFLYRAWLEAGGELDLVREPLAQWLLDLLYLRPLAGFHALIHSQTPYPE